MTGTIRTLTYSCVTIAVVLALVGCSSALDPVPDTSTPPSSTPSSIPSATESAKPELSAWPTARVPAECDELLGANELTLAMGIPAASYSASDSTANNGTISFAQGGMLTCGWESAVKTGPEEGGVHTRLEILPDASDAYLDMVTSYPRETFTPGLIGPDSLLYCSAADFAQSCTVIFDADGYWVELSFSGLSQQGATKESVTDVAVQIGASITDALSAAGSPKPAFVPAADAARPWGSCADIDRDGAFRSEIGSPSFTAPEAHESGKAMFSVAMQRAGYTDCVWRHADVYSAPAGEIRQLGIEFIPGAAWAWPELFALATTENADAEIAIQGADAAVITCSSEDNCTVQALVRGSYLAAVASNEQGNTADARAGAVRALELAIAAL